jgi:hypothetical protein
MDIKKRQRGGKRIGAGRPPLDPALRRVTTTIRVRPETDRLIREMMKAEKISVGKVVDKLLAHAYLSDAIGKW